MRILHVITGLQTGGAERALYTLLASGLAKNFKCGVISLSDEGTYGGRIRELAVPLWTLGLSPRRPSPLTLFDLRKAVQDFDPDILQGWMYHANLAAAIAGRFTRRSAPLVWNVRQTLYSLDHEKRATQWVVLGNRKLSSRPAAIIYNSALSRAQHQTFGFSANSGRVIPNGFDLDQWQPDSEARASVRSELEIPADALIVGHIARYHPMKDHGTFLRAIASLVADFPNVYFLLAGKNVHRSNPDLLPLLGTLPVERVRLLAEREDIERLMPALDVFCLSSWRGEAFPNVLGEAMACGVLCVSTDVGDTREIIGDTGIVCPRQQPQLLADAISTMLRVKPEERARLGQAARDRIRACYSLDVVTAEYESMYRELT